jgi:hypothetical protein
MRRLVIARFAGAALLVPMAWLWAGWQQWRSGRRGRRLSEHEVRLARRVGVARAHAVRVRVLPRMPVPWIALWEALLEPRRCPWHGVRAITLGHALLCIGGEPDVRLLAHELRHVQQREQAGSLWRFLWRYLMQVARHGYHDAPYEADARAAAGYSEVAGGP